LTPQHYYTSRKKRISYNGSVKGRKQFKRDRLRKGNSLKWLLGCKKENSLFERMLNLKLISS
jgi:hypothetical protein